MKIKRDVPFKKQVESLIEELEAAPAQDDPNKIGPVGYGGPWFENAWFIPPGARWVCIKAKDSSFYVSFSKEEPKL